MTRELRSYRRSNLAPTCPQPLQQEQRRIHDIALRPPRSRYASCAKLKATTNQCAQTLAAALIGRGPSFGNVAETSPLLYACENVECHGGAVMTTNLATFVCVGKKEKLQKHPLQKLTKC